MSTIRRTSHQKEVKGDFARAQRAGLIAGGNVFRNGVKRGLRGGYTTGNFVTGRVLNSVVLDGPYITGADGFILVGTDLARVTDAGHRNPYYPLYWELGHYNIFSRRYERVEIWGPAFRENRAAAIEAYARAFNRVMGGQGDTTITVEP